MHQLFVKCQSMKNRMNETGIQSVQHIRHINFTHNERLGKGSGSESQTAPAE